jgi:hypothetical protein
MGGPATAGPSSSGPSGDGVCKRLAKQLQDDLDEYMANNPEFPVC